MVPELGGLPSFRCRTWTWRSSSRLPPALGPGDDHDDGMLVVGQDVVDLLLERPTRELDNLGEQTEDLFPSL
jgi:hypothetical protein